MCSGTIDGKVVRRTRISRTAEYWEIQLILNNHKRMSYFIYEVRTHRKLMHQLFVAHRTVTGSAAAFSRRSFRWGFIYSFTHSNL